MKKAYTKGIIYSILSIILMATSLVLTKISLFYTGIYQSALTSLSFSVLLSFLYLKVRHEKITLHENKKILLPGIINGIAIVAYYISIDILNPITNGFVGRTSVIFAIILSVVILKEKLFRTEIILMIITFIGLLLFIYKPQIEFRNILGILLCLLYSFLFSLSNLLVKMKVGKNPPEILLFYNNSCSLIIFLLFIIFKINSVKFILSVPGLLLSILAAFSGNFLSLFLYYKALKHMDYSKANIYRSFSPFFLVMISIPFFGLNLILVNIIGSLIMICSLVALSLFGYQQKRKLQ